MSITSSRANLTPRRPWDIRAAVIVTVLLIGPVSGVLLVGCSASAGGISPAGPSQSAQGRPDDGQAEPESEVVPDDDHSSVPEDEIVPDDGVDPDDAGPEEVDPGLGGDMAMPADLLGLWVSMDQGDAETIYRFLDDGTYDQVSILMQERPSGTFSFIIQATGFVHIDGEQIVLTPTGGNEAMEDPDSPSSNFDRPLDDLTPEAFTWAMENGTLFLTGEYGTVGYEWTPEG